MIRKLLLSALLGLLASPALAQWQVTDHAVAVGNGAGVVGFSAATPGTAGRLLLDRGAATDPAFAALSGGIASIDGAGVVTLDGELQCLTALASAADKLGYYTGSGTCALTDLTATGRSLIDDASTGAMRTTLGLAIGSDVQAFDADLTTWAGITPGAGVGTFLATPSSANLAGAVTNETGSGALVFGTGPALTTPDLGTPSAVNLSNGTSLPIGGISASVVVTEAEGIGFNDNDTTLPTSAAVKNYVDSGVGAGGETPVNELLNGDLNFWQAGTSFTVTTTETTRIADMWVAAAVTGGNWEVTRQTDVPTVAQAGRKLTSSVRIECTVADASLNATSQVQLRIVLEGYDFARLYAQEITIGGWFKSDETGQYGFGVRNELPDRTYVHAFNISAADTWEWHEFTIPPGDPGGTWNFTNGEGVRIQIGLAAGADRLSTNNQWNNGYFIGAPGNENLAEAVGNYMQVAGLRMALGSDVENATDLSATETFDRLQRYYQKTYQAGTTPGTTSSDSGRYDFIATATSHRQPVVFSHKMRTTPTVTLYNPSSGASGTWRDVTGGADRTSTASNPGESGFSATVASTASGNIIIGHYVADARL